MAALRQLHSKLLRATGAPEEHVQHLLAQERLRLRISVRVLRLRLCCLAQLPGRCVFNLSESGRSLTALEGLGPSTQKTKTERRRRDFVAKTLQNVRVSMHSYE